MDRILSFALECLGRYLPRDVARLVLDYTVDPRHTAYAVDKLRSYLVMEPSVPPYLTPYDAGLVYDQTGDTMLYIGDHGDGLFDVWCQTTMNYKATYRLRSITDRPTKCHICATDTTHKILHVYGIHYMTLPICPFCLFDLRAFAWVGDWCKDEPRFIGEDTNDVRLGTLRLPMPALAT